MKGAGMKTSVKRFYDPCKVIPYVIKRIGIPAATLPPLAVELQPTTECGRNCVFCSYKIRNTEPCTLENPVDVIRSLGSLGVKQLYLSGAGEPCSFAKIDDLIKTAYSSGIEKIALITNGDNIERVRRVVHLLSYIQLSLHSVTPEIFTSITQCNPERVTEALNIPDVLNISGLLEKRPAIGVRCVISDENVSDVLNVHDAAKAHGFDYAVFRIAEQFETAFGEVGDGPYFTKYNELQELLADRLMLCRFDEHFTNLESLIAMPLSTPQYKVSKLCMSLRLRFQALIDPHGDMYLCVPDVGNKNLSIGNVADGDVGRVWNSKRHLEVEKELHKRYRNGLCQRCRCIVYNQEIVHYLREGGEFV